MAFMTNIRKEDLSLYYYIKDVVLCGFIELVEGAELVFSQDLSSTNNDADFTTNSYVYETIFENSPYPSSKGRGFVYFDSVSGTTFCSPYTLVSGTRVDGVAVVGTPEQSERIIVYDADMTVISAADYMIDYVDCRIVTSGTCNPAYIDYYWNYVSVLDEWAALRTTEPPIIVIDMRPYDKLGYQLGGGKKVRRRVDIHVFATNAGERNDLTETIYDGLYNKSCPIYNFPLGSLLEYDGTWYGRKNSSNKLTSLFDRGVLSDSIGNMWFDNLVVRNVENYVISNKNEIEFLDDLNAYRQRITFYMNYYTNI